MPGMSCQLRLLAAFESEFAFSCRYQDHQNPSYPGTLEGVKLQLDALREHHVGYTSMHFDNGRHPPFSVVGGRPFSHVRRPMLQAVTSCSAFSAAASRY